LLLSSLIGIDEIEGDNSLLFFVVIGILEFRSFTLYSN
jgi:hypothetical protein